MAKLTSAAKAGRSWWLFMARLKPCPFDSRWALEMGGSHAPSIRGADEGSVGSEHPANIPSQEGGVCIPITLLSSIP